MVIKGTSSEEQKERFLSPILQSAKGDKSPVLINLST